MADMAKSATCLPIHTPQIGASNHDTSSMPTVHCALFKMTAATCRGDFEVAEGLFFEIQ